MCLNVHSLSLLYHAVCASARGAMIRRKLRKTDPFKPIEFARRAQEQFSEVNDAIRR